MHYFRKLLGTSKNKSKIGKQSNNKKSNKNNRNNKKSNKNNKKSKKKPSAIYRNQRNQKLKIPQSKKVYTLQKFEEKFGTEMPKFRKSLQGNIVIMYDPNVPDGEDSPNQKTYIHYLEVDKVEILNYTPPNPPKGIHNYYSVSLLIDDRNVLEGLKSITDRTPEELQELHKMKKMFGYKIKGSNVIRINHFPVQAN
jgi:hypothetical protein